MALPMSSMASFAVRIEQWNQILVRVPFSWASDVSIAKSHGDISVNHLCTGLSTDSVDEID